MPSRQHIIFNGSAQYSSLSRAGGYWVKFMLNSMLVNKDFLTWHLIGWRQCCQPIRCQVWKSLLTNMDLTWKFLSNPGPRSNFAPCCKWALICICFSIYKDKCNNVYMCIHNKRVSCCLMNIFAYICTHFPSQKPHWSKGHKGEGKSFHDSHYDI